MAWVRLSDDFYDHGKFDVAGPLGAAMFCAALAWCNRNLTDGFITYSATRRLFDWSGLAIVSQANGAPFGTGQDVTADLVAELLVAAGIFEEVDGGYIIVNYTEYQRSADEIRELAAARSEAGKKGAETRWKKDPDGKSDGRSHSKSQGNGHSKSDGKPMAKSCPQPQPQPQPQESVGSESVVDESPPSVEGVQGEEIRLRIEAALDLHAERALRATSSTVTHAVKWKASARETYRADKGDLLAKYAARTPSPTELLALVEGDGYQKVRDIPVVVPDLEQVQTDGARRRIAEAKALAEARGQVPA